MNTLPQINLETLKTDLQSAGDRLRPDLEDLSLRIHAHPEIAFQEHQAAAWLSERLEQGGFAIERGVGGLATAFVGRYRGGPGPTLALVAEFDALPGVGHGCGHNIIGTSAVGAALALKEVWPTLPGWLIVTGKPGASPAVTFPASARFWSMRTTPSTAHAGQAARPATVRTIIFSAAGFIVRHLVSLRSAAAVHVNL